MVFKKTKKEEVKEEVEEVVEEKVAAEESEEKTKIVPMILTRADFDKMIYENNLMLRELLTIAKEE